MQFSALGTAFMVLHIKHNTQVRHNLYSLLTVYHSSCLSHYIHPIIFTMFTLFHCIHLHLLISPLPAHGHLLRLQQHQYPFPTLTNYTCPSPAPSSQHHLLYSLQHHLYSSSPHCCTCTLQHSILLISCTSYTLALTLLHLSHHFILVRYSHAVMVAPFTAPAY
jgi:hypothetical protein